MDFSWGTQVVALALTFVGGLATVLGTPPHATQRDLVARHSHEARHARALPGGSLALLAGTPNPRKLGAMLGGSSGVMLYIAFADLIPDSALAIGHPYTWLFVRVVCRVSCCMRVSCRAVSCAMCVMPRVCGQC
jgi:zinc transporter ZupT